MAKLKFLKISSLVFFVFILSGCQQVSLNDGLKMLDENIGKAFNNFQESQQNSVLSFFNEKKIATSTASSVDLSAAQKQAIDAWLEKKGLNKYGDAKNAFYTGGTPLYDEKTGRAIERYDYILNKFPDILEQIKKGN